MKKEQLVEEVSKYSGIKIIYILLFLLIVIYLYASQIGTKGLIVKEYNIKRKSLPDEYHGLKIVHFSDLHYGGQYKEKDLEKLVEQINIRKPDIVIYTGDLLLNHSKNTPDNINILIKHLSNIKSSLGKYYVKGNHDKYKEYQITFNSAGFHNLDKKEDLIYNNANNPILIVGDKIANKYFKDNDNIKPDYKIVVMHEPDNIINIKNHNFDIALAGHSHNGQLNIPYFKKFWMPKGARTYYNPYYKVNNTDFYISSGLGSSMLEIRLFEHPSFNFYRLTNK